MLGRADDVEVLLEAREVVVGVLVERAEGLERAELGAQVGDGDERRAVAVVDRADAHEIAHRARDVLHLGGGELAIVDEVRVLRILLERAELALPVHARGAAVAEHLFERRYRDELAEDARHHHDVHGVAT